MISGRIGPKPHSPLPQPPLQEMSTPLADLTGDSRLDTPNSELSDPGFPPPPDTGDAEDRHHSASESAGAGGCLPECKRPDTPTDRAQLCQSFPYFPVGPQHYLTAQQLATAVAAGLPPTPPCLNQPVLLPFNVGGQLGGHQGLVLSVPSPSLASIQGLMAAVAAGGVMTLPLQTIQATSSLNAYLQHVQKVQMLHRQKQDPHQQHQIQQQRLQYQQHLQHQRHQQQFQSHVQRQEKHLVLHQRQQPQQQLPRQEQPQQQQQQHQKLGQQRQHDLQHLRHGQQKVQQHLPEHIPQHGQLHHVQPPNHGQDHQEHPPNHAQDHQEHPPNYGQLHKDQPSYHGQLHQEQASNHGQLHHEQQPLHHGRIHQDPQYHYGQEQQPPNHGQLHQEQQPHHGQLRQERHQRQQNEHQQLGPPHLTLDRQAAHPRLTPPDPRQSPSSSTPSSSSHELRRTSPSLPDSTSPPQKRGYLSPSSMTTPLPPASPAQLSNQMAGGSTAIGSICGTQPIGTTVPGLQGVTGQLVTNAQGQIIGAIPLMPNTASQPNQAGGGASGLPVQPITPQLLTNTQGQIIATVIGNQILPVINTQGITLSPVKPGQQLLQVQQGLVGPTTACLHHRPHSVDSISQSPIQQDCSASSSPSPSCLGVGQLVNDPPGGTGEIEGVNLEEIREFAKAFRIRRLSLGLTQSQVGEALSAAESPAYSQSAICRHAILRGHFLLPQEVQDSCTASGLTAKLNPALLYPGRFEKLDITPKSAQKIKPVLERWMAEAEARHRSGIQNLSELMSGETAKKRKRRTSFTPQALEILNGHFERNTHPSGQEMTEIAEQLNYDREVVRVWFCNKRQALKNTIKRLKPAEIDSTVSVESLTDALMDPLDSLS